VIKRTIEISQQPVHVTVRNQQLVLLRKDSDEATQGGGNAGETAGPTRRVEGDSQAASGDPPTSLRRHRTAGGVLAAVPCEDIGVLLVEEQGTTYSHAALTSLLKYDAVVVVCGRDHLPAGLLLPLSHHTQVVWRIHAQLGASRPLQKRLWQQIVRAKIRAQAANLAPAAARTRLLNLARQVRSGDPSNIEAQAAKTYWTAWRASLAAPAAAPDFHRDPDGPPPNDLLNYGYAVLRAAVARALVSAGLLPAIGIHHAQRGNAFCLADDLVEPLRPLVDDAVRELLGQGVHMVTPAAKRALLELLTAEVRTGEQGGPLMVALHRYAASLAKCFDGAQQRLDIPTVVEAALPESG
jgi:CRISPR-associated protein Cas1